MPATSDLRKGNTIDITHVQHNVQPSISPPNSTRPATFYIITTSHLRQSKIEKRISKMGRRRGGEFIGKVDLV